MYSSFVPQQIFSKIYFDLRSGFTTKSEWFKNSCRHILNGVLCSGAILFTVSLYRIKNNRTDFAIVNPEIEREKMLIIFKGLSACLIGSFLLSGMTVIRPYTARILDRAVIRKNQVGFCSHFVEHNFWKMTASIIGAYYFLLQDDMFNVSSASLNFELEPAHLFQLFCLFFKTKT